MTPGFWESVRALVRAEVERVLRLQLQPHYGVVSEYDPKQHAAKVTLQPENVTTNWIPVESSYIGNGWGMLPVLSSGMQVKVVFPEYGSDQGSIVGRYYDSRNPPPQGAQDGDFFLVHQSGNHLKFTTSDKKVLLHNPNGAGLINIGDLQQTLHKLVHDAFQTLFNSHQHSNVQPGGGTSGPPVQQLTDQHMTTTTIAN
jgi:uncharacterized protein involved in type VI secretion and phage assembly